MKLFAILPLLAPALAQIIPISEIFEESSQGSASTPSEHLDRRVDQRGWCPASNDDESNSDAEGLRGRFHPCGVLDESGPISTSTSTASPTSSTQASPDDPDRSWISPFGVLAVESSSTSTSTASPTSSTQASPDDLDRRWSYPWGVLGAELSSTSSASATPSQAPDVLRGRAEPLCIDASQAELGYPPCNSTSSSSHTSMTTLSLPTFPGDDQPTPAPPIALRPLTTLSTSTISSTINSTERIQDPPSKNRTLEEVPARLNSTTAISPTYMPVSKP